MESMRTIVATYGEGHARTVSKLAGKYGSKRFASAVDAAVAELPPGARPVFVPEEKNEFVVERS